MIISYQGKNLNHRIKLRITEWLATMKQKRQITAFDLTVFFRQFATLINAGVPIVHSCRILEKSQEKIALRLLIVSIKHKILSGKNLYHSLRAHPRYFDEMTCELVQIGEHTGRLDSMLIIIANHREKQMAFKRQINQALFYPCIITISAIMMTLAMFFFIIPQFAALFEDMITKLPMLTRCIFYLSTIMQQYYWLLFVIFSPITIIFYRLNRSRNLHFYLRRLVENLPYLRKCNQKIILAQFTRNLAITITAGIPITTALKLTAKTCGSSQFASILNQVHKQIHTGLHIHQVIEKMNYFPILMVQMIKVGEESGMLDQMLDKIADFLEADIEQLISFVGQLLEPLIMLMLGVLIGCLIIGIYLPIFKLGSTL